MKLSKDEFSAYWNKFTEIYSDLLHSNIQWRAESIAIYDDEGEIVGFKSAPSEAHHWIEGEKIRLEAHRLAIEFFENQKNKS